jgi:hypothetical protein
VIFRKIAVRYLPLCEPGHGGAAGLAVASIGGTRTGRCRGEVLFRTGGLGLLA